MFTKLHFTIVEADITDILQPITPPGLLLLGRQLGVSTIDTSSIQFQSRQRGGPNSSFCRCVIIVIISWLSLIVLSTWLQFMCYHLLATAPSCSSTQYNLELETKAIRRFAKVSIVSYSRPSLMMIELASQFHVYLPWGQPPFSIVS